MDPFPITALCPSVPNPYLTCKKRTFCRYALAPTKLSLIVLPPGTDPNDGRMVTGGPDWWGTGIRCGTLHFPSKQHVSRDLVQQQQRH